MGLPVDFHISHPFLWTFFSDCRGWRDRAILALVQYTKQKQTNEKTPTFLGIPSKSPGLACLLSDKDVFPSFSKAWILKSHESLQSYPDPCQWSKGPFTTDAWLHGGWPPYRAVSLLLCYIVTHMFLAPLLQVELVLGKIYRWTREGYTSWSLYGFALCGGPLYMVAMSSALRACSVSALSHTVHINSQLQDCSCSLRKQKWGSLIITVQSFSPEFASLDCHLLSL